MIKLKDILNELEGFPKGEKPGNGWYTRTIGGKPVIKTLAGNLR